MNDTDTKEWIAELTKEFTIIFCKKIRSMKESLDFKLASELIINIGTNLMSTWLIRMLEDVPADKFDSDVNGIIDEYFANIISGTFKTKDHTVKILKQRIGENSKTNDSAMKH